MAPTTASDIFIGRQAEITKLGDFLESARNGHGQIVMVSGDPGIGKTRIAEELSTAALDSGVATSWARCPEQPGAPPLWPWIQITRSLSRQLGSEALSDALGSKGGLIVAAVPELREHLLDSQPAEVSEDQELARFRLFDSFNTLLASAGTSSPQLIVLDDIHWADEASLRLLSFIASEISQAPILLLGTFRDAEVPRRHPLAEVLAAMNRQRNFQRIHLSGLSTGHSARLFESLAADPRSAALVGDVVERAEGNPFFLREFAQLVKNSSDADSTLSLPEGARELVGRRLTRLTEDAIRILRLAAVIGRQFNIATLLQASDAEEQLVQGALDQAFNVQLLVEVHDDPTALQFSHALVHQALLDEVSPSRRMQWHARIAGVIEDSASGATARRAAELAHHYFEAREILGTDRALRFLRVAGQQALDNFAYEEARLHFERALHFKDRGAVDHETADLTVGLGKALGASGEVAKAWETLEEAFDHYFCTGDTTKCFEIATHPLLHVPGLTNASRMTDRALTLVTPESREAGHLLSRFGQLLNLETGDYESASTAFTTAMKIADDKGDRSLEMWTLAASVDADWYHLHVDEVITKSERVFHLARITGDVRAEVWPRFAAAYVSVAQGRLDEADTHAKKMLIAAERLHDSALLAMACVVNLSVSRLKGDLAAAREYGDRGLALEPRQSALLLVRAILEAEAGELDTAEEIFSPYIDIMRATEPGTAPDYTMAGYGIPAFAAAGGRADLFDRAREVTEVIFASPASTPLAIAGATMGRAWTAVQQGEIEVARSYYEPLRRLKVTVGNGWFITPMLPSIDRMLGLIATATGDIGAAKAHFEEALAFSTEAGFVAEEAWVCHDYAAALMSGTGGPSDRVLPLLDRCDELSTQTGLRLLVRGVETLRLQLAQSGRLDGGGPNPAGLSDREVQVLRLIAAGNTNAEIAKELVVSINTVLHHVTNIFNKTGARNRTEAAMFAAQQNIATGRD